MECGAWCGACSIEPRSEAHLLRIEEGPSKAHLVLLRSLSQSSFVTRLSIGLVLIWMAVLFRKECVPHATVWRGQTLVLALANFV
jgi:hypothetical protein